ncbi:hypothetical protein Vretimale_7473, partial [Volvox reticuliferus]
PPSPLRSRIPSPPPRPPPPSPSSRPRSLPSPPPPRPPSPSPPLRQPFPSLRPPSPSPPLRLLPPSQSPPRLLPPSPPPPRLLPPSPPPPRPPPPSSPPPRPPPPSPPPPPPPPSPPPPRSPPPPPSPPPPSPSSSPTILAAPPPPPSLVCQDNSTTAPYCASWKTGGYCEDGYYYSDPCYTIKDYWCPKTCGACGGPPPPPASNDPKIGGCVDADAVLDLHNRYRATHTSPPLVWNNTLASHAQTWATNLAAGGCGLQHEGYAGEGENLYAAWSSAGTLALNCSAAAKSWYDEVLDYVFTNTPYTDNAGKMIGHFTQVVWAATTQVGCAAVRGSQCYVVACRYTPQGNWARDCFYLKNVHKNTTVPSPPPVSSPPPSLTTKPPPPPVPPPPSIKSPPPIVRPPPPSTKVGGCMDPDAALDLHNQYRAYHSTPALAWDNTLATHAQAWAETLAAGGCGLKHEGFPDEGENLFAAWSSDTVDLNCTWAVEAWYDEVLKYSFTSTPYTDNRGKGIGHFTQVVWVDTTNVGCGAAESTTSSGDACYVVSCRYAPPGNYVGDGSYFDNVRPPA